MIDVALAVETAEQAAQSGGIGALGLDAKALIFQVINFAILFVLLRAFAYRPILKILEQRRQRIEESLKTASELGKMRAELATKEQEVLNRARREAQALLEKSEEQAKRTIQQAEEKARAKAEQIAAQTKEQVAQEVAEAKRSLSKEILSLVALATEKIIGGKLDPKKDKELVVSALNTVVPGGKGK